MIQSGHILWGKVGNSRKYVTLLDDGHISENVSARHSDLQIPVFTSFKLTSVIVRTSQDVVGEVGRSRHHVVSSQLSASRVLVAASRI